MCLSELQKILSFSFFRSVFIWFHTAGLRCWSCCQSGKALVRPSTPPATTSYKPPTASHSSRSSLLLFTAKCRNWLIPSRTHLYRWYWASILLLGSTALFQVLSKDVPLYSCLNISKRMPSSALKPKALSVFLLDATKFSSVAIHSPRNVLLVVLNLLCNDLCKDVVAVLLIAKRDVLKLRKGRPSFSPLINIYPLSLCVPLKGAQILLMANAATCFGVDDQIPTLRAPTRRDET